MTLVGGTSGWLVGDEGQVLTTADNGLSWTRPAGALPSGAEKFDYAAVAAYGTHCWIAGNTT